MLPTSLARDSSSKAIMVSSQGRGGKMQPETVRSDRIGDGKLKYGKLEPQATAWINWLVTVAFQNFESALLSVPYILPSNMPLHQNTTAQQLVEEQSNLTLQQLCQMSPNAINATNSLRMNVFHWLSWGQLDGHVHKSKCDIHIFQLARSRLQLDDHLCMALVKRLFVDQGLKNLPMMRNHSYFKQSKRTRA